MNDQEIQELKARVAQGGVWWRDTFTGVCKPVARVDLKWVEFPDQPDLTEPAARLNDGGAVALYNVAADSFVMLSPCVERTDIVAAIRTMRKHGFTVIQDNPGASQPEDDQMQRARTVADSLLAACGSGTDQREVESLAKALLQTADAARSLSQFQ